MDRREFLKLALAATAMQAAGPGCVRRTLRPDGSNEVVPVDDFLARGARVMWCAPHPDDECFPGSILARASIHHGNPLYFMIMTHGEGGECCIEEGCHPDLATVRGREMAAVARTYRGHLQHERFFNAPLPVESFPPRHEIHAIWKKHKDPVQVIATAMRRFRPDLVLTFDPHWGATGHPEHQLTSRLATAAVRVAADGGAVVAGLPPHRVERTYYVENRFMPLVIFGRSDPGPVTEVFDATLPCTAGKSCLDFMLEATRLHRTQNRDMSMVRSMRSGFETISLRQVDPFVQFEDPGREA